MGKWERVHGAWSVMLGGSLRSERDVVKAFQAQYGGLSGAELGSSVFDGVEGLDIRSEMRLLL